MLNAGTSVIINNMLGSYYFQIRGKSMSNSKNLQGEVWRLLGAMKK
jgi:hypothetical protein